MTSRAAIDTVIIFTTRMQELATFYQDAFELGEANHSPGHIGFRVGQVYLGFDQVEEEWASPSATTLWFRVDDVQVVFERLMAAGARERYGPLQKPWGDILASVYDLDGNLIGLSQRRTPTE